MNYQRYLSRKVAASVRLHYVALCCFLKVYALITSPKLALEPDWQRKPKTISNDDHTGTRGCMLACPLNFYAKV